MSALSGWFGITSMLCAVTGCVQQSYRLEGVEAERLAELPPEERGLHVRATQGSVYSPDPSDGAEADGTDPAQIVVTLNEAEARLLAAAVIQVTRYRDKDSGSSDSADNDGGAKPQSRYL